MKTILCLLCACLSSESTPAPPVLELTGTWVIDPDGRSPPPGPIARGLQPSGLVFRKGELWAVGDQRSEFPGHLIRMDPRTARCIGKPIRLQVPEGKEGEGGQFEAYKAIPNSDFEGLCLHPGNPDILFAVTEDKIPWIVEIHLSSGDPAKALPLKATIVRLNRIRFPPDLASWRDDSNFRFEGCAVSDDSKTMYLAFERARDELPRIYTLPLDAARSDKASALEELKLPFDAVPRRSDKKQARLNLNDIQFLLVRGVPHLLGIARDQERLILMDLERKEIRRIVDLVLLDPSGAAIEWVSPEGLALDPEGDALWLINDPDSMQGNYRARKDEAPSGRFAEYCPLLFRARLSQALGSDPPGKAKY